MTDTTKSITPVKPRQHCLSDNATVRAMLKAMRADGGYVVNHDKVKGVAVVTCDAITDEPVIVYTAMQKGSGRAPWIVTYSTAYFG